MTRSVQQTVKVADEVWIVTALLHRENPQRDDFTIKEILDKAREELIHGTLRPGVYQHAIQHCVANRPPDRGRYRILLATGRLTRRLYREGDPYHPSREGGKVVPEKEEIPSQYHDLVDWYLGEYCVRPSEFRKQDSILALRGLGKEIWEGVDPDEYVRQLREGWE